MTSKQGRASGHWRNQRLTSIALIPLCLWFLAVLTSQPSLDHAVVAAWFAQPLQAALAALLGAALLWHSMQGLQVVLEDYVRGRLLGFLLALLRAAHVAAALALGCAIWMLARGGAA